MQRATQLPPKKFFSPAAGFRPRPLISCPVFHLFIVGNPTHKNIHNRWNMESKFERASKMTFVTLLT
jgi:hypothetical protein